MRSVERRDAEAGVAGAGPQLAGAGQEGGLPVPGTWDMGQWILYPSVVTGTCCRAHDWVCPLGTGRGWPGWWRGTAGLCWLGGRAARTWGQVRCCTVDTSAVKRSIDSTTSCTITEKAPTRAFSWLKAPASAFTFKTLLRHYAKWALTPR